ncbi:RICIN domain-containing protein [Streptomyces sp. NPDC015139]|uniref:RICIN domain-containing protein n=1 Tax=Streptomyces sp. NPDC015139 TaxID=3364942 RepID=UPI003700A038
MTEVRMLPDGRLAQSVHDPANDETAHELRRRHERAALTYAMICCRTEPVAQELADQAITTALYAARRGQAPDGAWRPYVLTAVQNTAERWRSSERRERLSRHFLESTTSQDQDDLVKQAYLSLNERHQIALWHKAVEQEPDDTVALLIGCEPAMVGALARRALEELNDGCLRIYADLRKDDQCHRMQSLLEAHIRGSGRRTSTTLENHLTSCQACTSIVVTLDDLHQRLGLCLSSAFLQWAGLPYIAFHTDPVGGPNVTRPLADSGTGPEKAKRPYLLLGWGAIPVVAVVGLLSLTLLPEETKHPVTPASAHASSSRVVPTSDINPNRHVLPSASVSPVVTYRPRPSTKPTRTASVSPSPRHTKVSPEPSSSPARQWRSLASGRCLTVPDVADPDSLQLSIWDCTGSPEQVWTLTPQQQLTVRGGTRCLDPYEAAPDLGTAVDTNPCNGGLQQQWEIHSDGSITNVASGLCLDVNGGARANGTKIDLWRCYGTPNQLWEPVKP